MKLVILDGYCLNPGDLSWDALRQLVDLEVYDRTEAWEVVSRAADAELVMTNKTPLDAQIIAHLQKLRYIGVLATGYNMVSVSAAVERGVVISNIPTYGTTSVAQHAIALLLELSNHVGLHAEAVVEGDWAAAIDWCFWKIPLIELSGKTMGIVGFGRIGRQTAQIADALGMQIIANDENEANAPPYDGFRWACIDDLLATSDVVSLHCPLTNETQGLINAARLRTMKRSAFLLNTSRGPLVVDQDLADALNTGVIAGAGLDVLSIEPPAKGNPLFTAKHCIVTPHIAWATREARSRMMDVALSNLKAFLEGSPRNVVTE